MFEKIVLAVDDLDQARGAIAAAIDLATKSRGEVLMVHVHDRGFVSREAVRPRTNDDRRALTEAALDFASSKAMRVRGLRVERSAEVANAILRAAWDFRADTIVVGSRGTGGFAGLPLGSVAHRVIQQADCPVVVVGAAAASVPVQARGEGRAATAA